MADRDARMTVVVDTREQTPFEFSEGVLVARRALTAGDYSLEGLEQEVAIERKSLDDLVNTLIHNWRRFALELSKLQGMRRSAVVVEGSVADVLQHRYRSSAHPHAVLAAANAVFLTYGVPVFFWGSRPHCRRMLENLLEQIWKRRR